ncbi:MAG: PASTA domain-containing protein [Chlorobium sp.]|nr:MAG: PASTA domain-containing protein [Chlorobium sp.]
MKKAGVIVLILFGIALLFDKLLMPLYISQGSVKVVPDVTNMDYESASQRLRMSGFEAIKSYHVKYLSNVDSNLVISQIPQAGMEVKPGRNIYLVVNRREKPGFPMPDFVGRPEVEARQAAARTDILLEGVQVSAVANPEENGKVLSQSIPAQTMVKPGTAASLIIGRYEASALGMKKIALPDVLGMSLAQARQSIADAGLKVGTVTTEYSSLLVPNTVISQKPAVGSYMSPEQPVELTVVTAE